MTQAQADLGRQDSDDMLSLSRIAAVKLSPGELIDQKYRVVRILGTGGMGSVYEAENTRVERRVAIKVMHKAQDRQDVARFEREARAAQIGSPHIVQVFDLGYLSDGAPYMVMEYLAGESLGERLQRVGTLDAPQVVRIAKQILDALAAAHRAGIIHRDLKPDNVFLARVDGTDEEMVKLLDFGISKITDSARRPADMSLTRSGVAIGTPHYMSPEQVQGAKDIDFRTDLYSLGVILYRCLSGQLPFESQDVAPLLVQILLETPKPVHEVRPGTDLELSQIVARSMSRQASDRFSTAPEYRAALTAWEARRSAGGLAARSPSLPTIPSAPPNPYAPQLATNAPWSSTAAQQVVNTSPRTLRNVVLAAAFLLAGAAGLVIAYRIWSSEQAPVSATAGNSAAAPPTVVAQPPVAVVVQPPPVAAEPPTPIVVTTQQQRAEQTEQAAEPNRKLGADAPRRAAVGAGVKSTLNDSPRFEAAVPVAPPQVAPPAPALPPSLVPPPAVPAVATPASDPATGASSDEDEALSNRHMSRGVR